MFGPQGFFSDFGQCARMVATMFCTCFCAAPIMIVLGIVALVLAHRDMRKKELNSYNTAVTNWVASGKLAFQNAFPSGNATLTVIPPGGVVRGEGIVSEERGLGVRGPGFSEGPLAG